MMIQTIKWHEGVVHGCASFPSSAIPIFNTRKKIEVIRVTSKATKFISSESNGNKVANLCAAKTERIKLPNYDVGSKSFHISEFLSHQSGIEAMLNTRALESFQSLDADTYRCTLPKLKLLNYEAAPVLDLRVTPTNEDCIVEMLSCRFEGSEAVERQNSHFSAFMTNHMSWDTNNSESFLEVDVKLQLTLEIYTRPFNMMPVSAVERPGNLMMQALVDRLVPLLLQQLLQDYGKWIDEQVTLPSNLKLIATSEGTCLLIVQQLRNLGTLFSKPSKGLQDKSGYLKCISSPRDSKDLHMTIFQLCFEKKDETTISLV